MYNLIGCLGKTALCICQSLANEFNSEAYFNFLKIFIELHISAEIDHELLTKMLCKDVFLFNCLILSRSV